MKVLSNTGRDRVIDALRDHITKGQVLNLATTRFSIFAFAALRKELAGILRVRAVIPESAAALALLGGSTDQAARNQLHGHWLAGKLARWVQDCVEVRTTPTPIPQGSLILTRASQADIALTGACGFSTEGLGLGPGNPLGLAQATESATEANQFAAWFEQLWDSLAADPEAKQPLLNALHALASHRSPALIYHLILHHLFATQGEALDEEQVIRSATGIHDTVVWNKLYPFQRDGVVGAIDKLNRYGGCIIADSVGLGKTFEALAVIKYHELRNDRVLVLCPKRLRDNWTMYTANDRRNVLATDRFNYDVLNHTDLSRDRGLSGNIDLAHVNWGNYDLVVIDESHNFRNKITHKDRESRYQRLMRKIIREGVKTRVLMLSATPVNNRLADLRNQLAFATEGNDAALADHGIESIGNTTRRAQSQFNHWLKLDEAERTPARLVGMLGFDYFRLLDLLTLARSRKHIEKYYGLQDTGRFPTRRKPINRKPGVDTDNRFPAIGTINNEIRRLHLAVYAALGYLLAGKRAAYDAKYSMRVRGGTGFFRQADREKSLVNLMRVNLLKRMESSVVSFALTVERQLADIEATLTRIEAQAADFNEIDISDVDLDDPMFESLLVGRKVKVLLQDIDLVHWRQDLAEDRDRLTDLLKAAKAVHPDRDAKLAHLREMIEHKCRHPINPGNRKVIIFTAFADTARYLYSELAPWANDKLALETALVTGSGSNQATLPGLHNDLSSILAAFAPEAKERPEEDTSIGNIDLLIATDCISEGQNLQDCDWLINYDIHWNPVRIIQRFGRIDRIGSPNESIQLANFWPNMELEEYINLEQRVSGRMVLLDVSATGEENLIEQASGNRMNDLEYRRKQLARLQDAVIDIEDLSSGISITDLTLTDFRIDLADYRKAHPDQLEATPPGPFAVTTSRDTEIPPGIVFCLRAESEAARRSVGDNYPLAPYFLVHVGEDGSIVLPCTQARQALDHLKRLCAGQDQPDDEACRRFDQATRDGADMNQPREDLAKAAGSILGKGEQRAVESLFTAGHIHTAQEGSTGINDFEVIAWLAVLPEQPA